MFHKKVGPFTLSEIAAHIQATVETGDIAIAGVAALDEALIDEISFLDNPKYVSLARATKAAAVILNEAHKDILPEGVAALVVKNPYASYARVLQLFYPQQDQGIIHPTAVIEENAKIGANVSIGAHCYIGEHVTIGENTHIASGVTITHSYIGKNCIIHPNVAIGQDGFGFARDGMEIVKIPQIGAVRIGDNVEIGANTTIDRGALTDTVIGNNCKIDNQVQIAHNVKMGEGCQISGQTGIAGSATLGNNVIAGGKVGINGHISIADGVMLAGNSLATKSITQAGSVVSGFPAIPIKEWRVRQARMNRILKKSDA